MYTQNEFTSKGFTVWFICALFFLYEFFLRTVIGTFQFQLTRDLDLSSLEFSFLSTTVFLVFYGAGQIPGGLIVGRIGLKKSLLTGSIICTIASIGFGYSTGYAMALFFRMLMGIGSTFGFICLLVSVYEWMPNKHNALMIGISSFVGTIGPMVAAGPLDSLLDAYSIGWRPVFISLGFIAVIILFLVILFVENNPRKSGAYTILHPPEKIKASVFKMFKRSQPWFISIFSACTYFSLEYLSENEGRIFLALKGIKTNSAAYMITTSWIGYALGCPFLGFLSDHFRRRKSIMVAATICLFISIMIIIFLKDSKMLTLGFFLMGLGASGQSIGFAIIADQFKKRFVAVAFGFNNALIGLIPSVLAPFIGWTLDQSSGHKTVTLEDYYLVFISLIIIAVISFIVSAFFIQETYGKSKVEFTYLNVGAK
jgi:MFS family permease